MKTYASIICVSLAFALSACGSDKQDSATATLPPPPGTGQVQISKSNVFSPLVQDLNKAKQVNGQVQQQAQNANNAIEADTAPSAATAQP